MKFVPAEFARHPLRYALIAISLAVGCADGQPTVAPLPLPMANLAQPAVQATAARRYAAVEQVALDGPLTALANQWFARPQQRYVPDWLAGHERRDPGLLFAACALLLAAIGFWHFRRMVVMRRTAAQAWSRAMEAERRFAEFMAHTPAISFIKDVSGRIVYVNHAFEHFHGISAAQAAGRLDRELFGDNAAAMRDRDDEVMQSGHPLQYVLNLPGRDGALHHLLVLKFPLAGEAGPPLLGAIAIDITQQQRAADLVAGSEERYRLLFEESPIAIHEIDRQGLVTRINRAGCALCGYTRDEIVGYHASDFVAREYQEESRAAVRAKLSGARSLAAFERQYQCKDGRLLRVEVHETAILGPDGAIQGLRSCLVDLTERYQAQHRLDAFAVRLQENNATLAGALESANEATRLKSRFLANMSHEIRTPMNGVIGMAELLVRSGLTGDQRALALNLSQSGEHLLDIINDILDFSKVESGNLELESAPFDLTAVVEAAVDLMAPAAHGKGLELTCWIEPEVPACVLGDSARLRQVLLNLLGNAVKFTQAGEIAVRVSVDAGSRLVRVTVIDTGIGICSAAVPNIFAAFSQADGSTTRRFGGTGLGLAIARSIVELMGGEVGVESREGSGSTFWFTAALAAPAAPGAVTTAAPDPDSDVPQEAHSDPRQLPRLPDARLLIVDDNWTSRTILQRYAKAWGMRIQAVADGPQALAALRARSSAGEPFDVALVDMQMPGMNGATLLHEIARDPSLCATVVVRLTSAGVLAEGDASASVRKPVKPADLNECLGRALQPVFRRIQAPAASVPAPAPSRGRILIAEDNAINQRVASLQVRHCGFEFDVVADGEEALAALARITYILVLMDCQMPGMDGYAATRELRRREIGGRRTPVIAVTANAFATDRDACLEAGMDDHISKPVSLRDLADMLDRWSGVAVEE